MTGPPPITITTPMRMTAPVQLTSNDVQGHGVIACPNPRMPLWSNHPRVFIDVVTTGHGKCPYCGTEYVLPGGAAHAH